MPLIQYESKYLSDRFAKEIIFNDMTDDFSICVKSQMF